LNLKQVRFEQRKDNFDRSLQLLEKQAQRPDPADENIGATLHFYEMTFELAWKLLKDLLDSEGIIVRSPRETLKTAFALGYISDDALWLEMLDARNAISHAYDRSAAESLFQQIRERYLPALTTLRDLKCTD